MPLELVCITTGYQFCDDDYHCHCKPCGKERYARDLVWWRQRQAAAVAAKDYDTLDVLDRHYELIGLP